jgi:Zn finger protein HypA/HybF involved in hydrogenase expression
MLFQCYYCGGTKYRVLRQPHMVECLTCGRSSKFGEPDVLGCPKCGGPSFSVVPGSDPQQVECLRCGTVSPFAVWCADATGGH